MEPMVYIIPIENITDAMCPEFKDEYVNGLDRNEVRALCCDVMLLCGFVQKFNADTTGKYSSDRIFIRII